MKKVMSLTIVSLLSASVLGCAFFASKSQPIVAEVANTITPVSAFQEDIISLYPGVGQKDVTILKAPVLAYLKAMYASQPANDFVFNSEAGANVKIADYYSPTKKYETAKKIPLFWKENALYAPYTVKISTDPTLENPTTYVTKEASLYLDNLYCSTTYYWQVFSADGAHHSLLSNFTTGSSYRMIAAGNIDNVRDIGGRMTSSGKRVKQGLIYRGAEINGATYTASGSTHWLNLDASSLAVFRDVMGIRTELDFRTSVESNAITASYLGTDVTYLRKSIGAYTSCLSSGQATLFKEIFLVLKDAATSHVYFHCWGGADRTGTIGFLLNGLLGVSYTDLIADYELTSFSTNYRAREDGTYKGTSCYFTSMVNQLKDKYMTSATMTISETIEAYMEQGLGLSSAEVAAIKTNLLED
jgi:protein-tyrosine phosphatase